MAFQLWEPRSVIVTRPAAAETQDTGGGWVAGTPTQVFNGLADLWISNTVNAERDEANPGIATRKIRRFTFLNPVGFLNGATAFLAQDLVTVTGTDAGVYTVQFVWVYDDITVAEGWVMQ